jgi:tetratricopeptide (TPR) repeat protein
LGTGPATYLSDFTRFRPISYNLTPSWAIRFNSSTNYYLQLVATVGLLGTGAFLFLGFKVLQLFTKSFRTTSESAAHHPALAASLSASLILISFLLLPVNTTVLFILFAFLVIAVSSFKLAGSSVVHEANIEIVAAADSGRRSPILPWVCTAATLLVLIPSGLFFTKAYLAEVLFQKALVYASKNNGKATYDTLNRAIRLNPFKDSFRVAASQTNLLLANSAASKKDLTAEDRTLITQLIQQAIREAKNAVALNPLKATNVENLASTYQNLLNYAQGADSWAIASYRQAITLDPANPALRVSLGGIYYAQKNYEDAQRLFQQAADLKPNYSNAFYNLSAAYKEKKDYAAAFQAMQTVVNTLDKSSADYPKAQKELEDLAKLANQAQPAPAAQGTELESPKPLPSPKVNPPLNLPSDLGPESTITPTPTLTPLNPVTP